MKYDKDMLYIEQIEAGEKIYHYTTMDAFINIVEKKEFWVTKWNYLNDRDEFQIAIEVLIDVLEKNEINQKVIQDVKRFIKQDLYRDGISDDYYVLSTSCDRDNQLMWSYYSNRDGVNIEIDSQALVNLIDGSLMWQGLVNYNYDSQRENIEKSLCDELFQVEDFGFINAWKEINDLSGKEYNMLITHISIICELYSMFYKRNCFSNENEYRFVFSKHRNEPKTRFRSKNGIIIPYITNHFDSLEFVKSVTLGPTNNMDNALDGITELLRYNNCRVNVRKSEVPLRF